MGKFEDAKRGALLKSLLDNKWNISAVTKDLGISRATVYRSLKRYGIERNVSR